MQRSAGVPGRSGPPLALVTGATSGIGRAIALELATRGYDLLVTGRDEQALGATTARARAAGRRATAVVCDLDDSSDISDLCGRAADLGGVDVLVNCAGRGGFGPLHGTPWELTSELLDVNVVAATRLMAELAPDMVARGSGHVLNIASTSGFFVNHETGVYNATKAYLVSLSRSVALELRGTGVTATAFCPGPTRSSFAERAGLPQRRRARRLADPADVAQAAVDAMFAGRAVVIHGRLTAAAVAASRLLPAQQVAVARRSLAHAAGARR